MNANLTRLTSMFSDREPATAAQVAALEKRIRRSLPQDYKEYLLKSNGGEGLIDGSEIMLRMYGIDEIESTLERYDFRGFWVLGTNDFGMVICLDCRKKAKSFFVATGESDFTRFDPKCETFEEFLLEAAKRAPAKQEPKAKPAQGLKEKPATGPLREICTLKIRKPNDWAMLFPLLSPDGTCVYTLFNGWLTRWDLPSGELRFKLRQAVCKAIVNGELITLDWEKGKPWRMSWRDPQTGNVNRSSAPPEDFDCFSSVSADGKVGIAYNQASKTIGAVDLTSGKVLGTMVSSKLSQERSPAVEGRLTGSGKFCLLGHAHDLSVYALPEFKEVCRIEHKDYYNSLNSDRAAISPDETILLYDANWARIEPGKGWTHGETVLYAHDLLTGTERYTVRDSVLPFAKRSFLPDGKAFISGAVPAGGKTAYLAEHDAATGKQLRVLKEDKTGQFSMVQTTPDGRMLLTYDEFCQAGSSFYVRVWGWD